MFGAILKAANSSFQKGITFCRSIYVKKVMKLLAFIFEQPSYALLQSRPKWECYKQHKAASHLRKCVLINDIILFPTVY